MMTVEQAYEFGLLVTCVWREARGEVGLDPKHGVAWVIKNRAAKGGWWGKTISQVILKPFQFSSFNGPDKNGHVDANATKFPIPETDPSFSECLLAAKHVVEDTSPDPTHGACWYHDTSIAPPSWTVPLTQTVQLGNLIFYKETT